MIEKIIMKKSHLLRCISVILFTFSTISSAVVLNIDSNGKLLGATGIIVGSEVYDIAFVDGSCIGLFSGCDEPSDFFFNDTLSAGAASTELFTQVFIDSELGNFDSNPGLTNGCGSLVRCTVFTPVGGAPLAEFVPTVTALNRNFDPLDGAGAGQGSRGGDFTSNDTITFGIWSNSVSQVPVPAAVWLFGTGLIGLFGVSKRRKN